MAIGCRVPNCLHFDIPVLSRRKKCLRLSLAIPSRRYKVRLASDACRRYYRRHRSAFLCATPLTSHRLVNYFFFVYFSNDLAN